MSKQNFILSHTQTTTHMVTVDEHGQAALIQQIQFDLDRDDIDTCVWFLTKVKGAKTVRHTYTDTDYGLEYDPANDALTQVSIMNRKTGRHITMALSTAYKLLDALTGKTERLVKDDE